MITTSTILITMMASPGALQLDHKVSIVPMEPKHHIEHLMLSIPIHPLHIAPKKILGDKFVDSVRAIDRRAEEINSFSYKRVTVRQ